MQREVERALQASVLAVLERELRSRDFLDEVASRQAALRPLAAIEVASVEESALT